MINERKLTVDHPSEHSLSAVFNSVESRISHDGSNSDATEVVMDDKARSDLPSIIDEEDCQDGGYGWFVVLGAFLVQVTTFGTITSWGNYLLGLTKFAKLLTFYFLLGVMQDYYEQYVYKGTPNAPLNLSFVGTLALVFLNFSGPFAQVLVSIFGIRTVLVIGTICISLGLEMASLSYEIWHLYLSQGVLFGIGASCVYMAMMGVAPQWFNKRRGLALGLIASGSGIGGLVIPNVMNGINTSLGPAWTYRILGFICLFCDIWACLLVRPRNPGPRSKKRLSEMIDLRVLKNIDFLLFCIGSNVGLLGYFVPYFYLPSYATYIGLSDSQGSAAVSVSAAGNFVGRIVIGYLGDRIGKVNAFLIFTIITALSSFLIWTFAINYGVLLVFAAIFGLTSGAYFAQVSPITVSILGMQKFPSGLSLMLLTNSIPVFGPNIAGAIEASVGSTPFFTYKVFTGVVYIVSALVLLILKIRLDQNIFAKV